MLRLLRTAFGAGLVEGYEDGEAEDVVSHAGLSGGPGDEGFEAAVYEAAEEDFVFGAFVRHARRVTAGRKTETRNPNAFNH